MKRGETIHRDHVTGPPVVVRFGFRLWPAPGDDDDAVRLDVARLQDQARLGIEVRKAAHGQAAFGGTHRIEQADVGHLAVGVAATRLNHPELRCTADACRQAVLFHGLTDRTGWVPWTSSMEEAEHDPDPSLSSAAWARWRGRRAALRVGMAVTSRSCAGQLRPPAHRYFARRQAAVRVGSGTVGVMLTCPLVDRGSFSKPASRSIGSGKMMVEFFSTAISVSVWR